MSKNKWLVISALSMVSGIGVAAAQGGEPAGTAKLDANGDGSVTTAEFEAHLLERWTTADANKDGKVGADEMKAQLEAHKGEHFAKLDANGNGVIERTEIPKMPDPIFAKADTDKNGTLTEAELAAGHPKMDGKGHGAMKGLPGDTNKDGAVTKEEAVAESQKLAKRLDADGDGKLSQQELSRGHGLSGGPGAQRPPRMGAKPATGG